MVGRAIVAIPKLEMSTNWVRHLHTMRENVSSGLPSVFPGGALLTPRQAEYIEALGQFLLLPMLLLMRREAVISHVWTSYLLVSLRVFKSSGA